MLVSQGFCWLLCLTVPCRQDSGALGVASVGACFAQVWTYGSVQFLGRARNVVSWATGLVF